MLAGLSDFRATLRRMGAFYYFAEHHYFELDHKSFGATTSSLERPLEIRKIQNDTNPSQRTQMTFLVGTYLRKLRKTT